MLFRNKLYDWYILPSKSFLLPIISVGNLSVGGTGKTPQVEYLIRILQKNSYKVATLSRGYRRKTSGFIVASPQSTFQEIGDEPLQYKNKFPDIEVAVDEKRARGIRILNNEKPELDVVLLDDAFQHRSVKPGLSILLSDYHNLYINDYVLPTGNLREPRAGSKRADIIIITKTPSIFSPIIKRELVKKLKLKSHQKLFFSYIAYNKLLSIPGTKINPTAKKINTILLFSGIANSYPLQEHLKDLCSELIVLEFPDHHKYSKKDLEKIISTYNNIFSTNKALVTTEKDSMRLIKSELISVFADYPVYYVPIEVKLHLNGSEDFDKIIIDYVEKNKRSSRLHTQSE